MLNGVEDRTLCRPVKFFYTKLIQPCLYGPFFLFTGAQSCWNRKGPSPNCSHKMSQYAEALRFIFTGTKGPNPRNSPIPVSLLHQTLQLAQCGQTGNVVLSAKPRLVHQKWDLSLLPILADSFRSQFTLYDCHSREQAPICLWFRAFVCNFAKPVGNTSTSIPQYQYQYQYPSSTKLYSWHNVVRQVTLYYLPNPDLSIRSEICHFCRFLPILSGRNSHCMIVTHVNKHRFASDFGHLSAISQNLSANKYRG